MRKSFIVLLLTATFSLTVFSIASAANGKIVLPYSEILMEQIPGQEYIQVYANITNRSKFELDYYIRAIDKNGEEIGRYPSTGNLSIPGLGGMALDCMTLFPDLSSDLICASYQIVWSANAWRIVTPFCVTILKFYNSQSELVGTTLLNFYDNSIFY